MLGKDMITDPMRWQLVMELSADALQVVAFTPYEHQAMIYDSIGLDKALPTELKQVENAVYDNPMLLGDFGRVTVLCDTLRFLVIPDLVAADEDVAVAAFRRVFPDNRCESRGEVIVSRFPDMQLAVAFEISSDVSSFLRRTFPSVAITHPLIPLCAYFRSKHRTRGYGKMLVNLGHGRLDVVILGDSAPLLVNSYRFREPMDAVYYILAARKTLRLSDTDEIIIGGDRMLRAQVTPVLRRYVRYVMPAIFPSVMFKAGRASLSAPFEMVLSPLTDDMWRRRQESVNTLQQ